MFIAQRNDVLPSKRINQPNCLVFFITRPWITKGRFVKIRLARKVQASEDWRSRNLTATFCQWYISLYTFVIIIIPTFIGLNLLVKKYKNKIRCSADIECYMVGQGMEGFVRTFQVQELYIWHIFTFLA